MFTTKPKISIVIATYNAAKTLERCLESIRKQTYKNYEVIIADGLSKDDTVVIIKNNDDLITKWISEKDSGIYDAWNKAVAFSKGEWIWFLGADDYFYNDHVITDYVNYLSNVPSEINIIYSKVLLVNTQGEPIYSVGKDWNETKQTFFKYMNIPHQGVLHRNSLFKNANFDLSFKIAGDYEFLLRDLLDNQALFYPINTVCMQVGGVSSNAKMSLITVREIRMAQKKHGEKLPNLHIALAYMRAYIRIAICSILGLEKSKLIMDLCRKIMGKQPYWTKT